MFLILLSSPKATLIWYSNIENIYTLKVLIQFLSNHIQTFKPNFLPTQQESVRDTIWRSWWLQNMQSILKELTILPSFIVLLFPMDILSRNNMVYILWHVDRKPLCSCRHMYRQIVQVLLNHPRHFQMREFLG